MLPYGAIKAKYYLKPKKAETGMSHVIFSAFRPKWQTKLHTYKPI